MQQQRVGDAVEFHRQVDDRLRGLLARNSEPPTYSPPTYQYNPSIRLRREG